MAYRMTKDEVAAIEAFVNDYLKGKADAKFAGQHVSALRKMGVNVPRKAHAAGTRKPLADAHKAKLRDQMKTVWAIYRQLQAVESRAA
jgi:hypothetical protein